MSLTIAIPTYNRAEFLERLLRVLEVECTGIDDIEILVSDNASTDGTAAVLADFEGRSTFARIIRNPQNLGAEKNVVQCFAEAKGTYVWIMGDDDRPVSGMVAAVCNLMQARRPALIYLPSVWTADIYAVQDPLPQTFSYREMEAVGFAGVVAYWFTFLSGIVVDKQAYLASSETLPNRFLATNFPQLAWVYENLARGALFVAFKTPGVIATGGNSGSYAVLTAFGFALPQTTKQVFGLNSKVYRRICNKTLIGFLPDLIWSIRFRGSSKFSAESPWSDLRRTFQRSLFFWLVIAPIFWLPKYAAAPFYVTARLSSLLLRVRDMFR